ncbi:hypothetical protein GV794_02060 [Nocardia cyriacigeorgica]|uniref:Uncharacterized protein n=1 Tax=Nocardia cyriacigeorgica TaxID=135487 RepID=A0ABX0CF67_9NOCA|nr:hypothetical protein [Nocardia cyriacigeorgica]NEW42745.1 hypothetical protein [Nocardia cyriacigeorgica]NEW53960.1 hypothetical protein [Nocardia cyriacigeorgica]NEW54451.1 hypothetical protein [Nocardia cyriacigeorgica]
MNAVECIECARPVGDRLPLCTECGENIVKQLLDVPRLITELEVTRTGLGRVTAPAPVGRSTDTPIPVRAIGRHGITIQGDRELRDLSTVITEWADHMSALTGTQVPYGARGLIQLVQNLRLGPEHRQPVAPPIRRHPKTGKFLGRVPTLHATLIQITATLTEQAAVWLAHRGNDLRALEPAEDPADRLHVRLNDAIAAISRIIDRPTPRRYLGACPADLDDNTRCGYELYAQIGDDGRPADLVKCGRCRTQHFVDRIQAKAREAAEDQSYTIPDLVKVTKAIGAPIPERTLYHWANKSRRLESRGWQHADDRYGIRITDHQIDTRDRQVYRLGDALELARQSARKKGSAA